MPRKCCVEKLIARLFDYWSWRTSAEARCGLYLPGQVEESRLTQRLADHGQALPGRMAGSEPGFSSDPWSGIQRHIDEATRLYQPRPKPTPARRCPLDRLAGVPYIEVQREYRRWVAQSKLEKENLS